MTYTGASYYADGYSCTRIPYFSSPDITYSGLIIGDAQRANNVRTIKRTKHAVARYSEFLTATRTISNVPEPPVLE
jgi:hypothetical protein